MEILDGFQQKLKSQGDTDNDEELERIKQMLESPLFRQLLVIQQSVKELNKQLKQLPPGAVQDFEFSPTGELVFPRHSVSEGEETTTGIRNEPASTAGVFDQGPQENVEPAARNGQPEVWADAQQTSYAFSSPEDLPTEVEFELPHDNRDQIAKELKKSKFGKSEEIGRASCRERV